jgi:hypothetical protein
VVPVGGHKFLVETIKDENLSDSVYGIATVTPNRALKKCRIRRLRVEYILCDSAVIVTVPHSCGVCKRMKYCIDDFIIQIMIKTSQSPNPHDNIWP